MTDHLPDAEQYPPTWVTRWPEWYGIDENVAVVPAEDYDKAISQLKMLREQLERLRPRPMARAVRSDNSGDDTHD